MKSYEKYISAESEYFVYTPSKSAQEMFFYPLQCGHFIYEAGYSLFRDSYDSFLLMYIQKGKLTLRFQEQIRSASEGQFLLLDCYQPHAYSSDTGWECLWCHFDGVLARRWYTNVVSRLGTVFALPESALAAGKLSSLYDAFASGAPVKEPLMSKYLSDFLTICLLYTPAETDSHNSAAMAEETAAYINEHFSKNLTLKELADRAGLSQFHFIRIFKKETGFTPHEYLINTRIATAKYLLKNTGLSVKDICFSTGFSCESVFCSAFKKHLGITPGQYRSSL